MANEIGPFLKEDTDAPFRGKPIKMVQNDDGSWSLGVHTAAAGAPVTGTVQAVNDALQITLDGRKTLTMLLTAGALGAARLSIEESFDGGTTWTAEQTVWGFDPIFNGMWFRVLASGSLPTGGNFAVLHMPYLFPLDPGATHARAIITQAAADSPIALLLIASDAPVPFDRASSYNADFEGGTPAPLVVQQVGGVGPDGGLRAIRQRLDGAVVTLPEATTGTPANVVGSTAAVTILAGNAARRGASIYNDSTAVLYLLFGAGTASATNYSRQVPAQGYVEAPFGYTGDIGGVWAAANGAARVTEYT